MLLFHGSKSIFANFEPRYYRSGEGAGEFEGWYFAQSLKGAYKHVESYLRNIEGPGYVYVCNVPGEIAILDCESGFTDSCYHGQAVGVSFVNSDKIEIVERLPAINLLDETMGSPRDYILDKNKAALKGGILSRLRRLN